jgi:hypothetical protein
VWRFAQVSRTSPTTLARLVSSPGAWSRDRSTRRGELFDGEGQALVGVLVDEQDGHVFAARVLAQAAIWLTSITNSHDRQE